MPENISPAKALTSSAARDWTPPKIDTTKPHSARMYDYYLGGKDHYSVDRETAEKAARSWTAVKTAVRENRTFLGRAVRYLTKEVGIRQFLDIGTGLPSANNVHEVAQSVAPDSRIVYVDNDPIVLVHARSLLTSTPQGRTAYIDADLRHPEDILNAPATRETLDFSKPIALILVAILHFIPDEENPRRILRTLIDALPSGSYFVATHVTDELNPVGVGGLVEAYRSGGVTGQTRTAAEFAELAFSGMELVDPGVVLVSEWRRPADSPLPPAEDVSWFGGVARKK